MACFLQIESYPAPEEEEGAPSPTGSKSGKGGKDKGKGKDASADKKVKVRGRILMTLREIYIFLLKKFVLVMEVRWFKKCKVKESGDWGVIEVDSVEVRRITVLLRV